MKQIQTIEDVYPAIEELIAELKLGHQAKLALILDHRMHQVAWTSRSEIFEELQSVLTETLQSEEACLTESVRDQIRQIARVVKNYLNGNGGSNF